MEYNSLSKMAKELSTELHRTVTIREIQRILKHLNCLDIYNYPTPTALGCNWCKMKNDYRGRKYATWSEEVEREVYEILLSKQTRK